MSARDTGAPSVPHSHTGMGLFSWVLSWLPSSWRGAELKLSRPARVKSELSKNPDAPVPLKHCIQAAFLYDGLAVQENPTSPLYHDIQSVTELAFDACVGMLEYWKWLVENTASNGQEVTMDLTLREAVTDAFGCV